MITIPEVVEKIVKAKPFLEDALNEGIINISSLARQIKPEIESELKKSIQVGAIVMAIKRMAPGFIMHSDLKALKAVESFGDIIVRSNLIVFTYSNTSSLVELQSKLLHQIKSQKDVFHTFSQGVFETTFIISKQIAPFVNEIFKDEKLIAHNEKLSSITLKLPRENTTITGFYYFILKKIAWEGINIHEVISTSHEFTLIVKDQDIDRVFSLLKRITL
ncbi:MAG: aspartate kinase [Bacteroidales bacterium]